ncbi:MAG: hypothetical protein ACFFBH_16090 [Promethearchaeota archaeon]
MVQIIEEEMPEKELISPKEISEAVIKVVDNNKMPINQINLIFHVPDGLDSMKKNTRKKVLKNWKKKIDYYYTHLDKFPSGFEDL